MKKYFLMASVIVFMGLFAVSCSSDDKTYEEIEDEIEDETVFDIKNSPEYSEYNSESAGFIGDVKIAVASEYRNAVWNVSKGAVDEGEISIQYEYEYDTNGFKIRETKFNSWITPTGVELFRLVYKKNYKYDSSYRVLEIETVYYNSDGKIQERNKEIYEYDAVTNEVAISYYTADRGGEFVASNKEVYSLDRHGRLDKNAAGYRKDYDSKYAKSANVDRAFSVGENEPSLSVKNTIVTSKDQKGNIVLKYYFAENISYNRTYYVNQYQRHEFTYHDGTVSSVGKSEETIEGGSYVAKKVADWSLKGNVKSFKNTWYSYYRWDEQTQRVIPEGLISSSELYNFDDNGFFTYNERYQRIHVREPFLEVTTYKYDSKFRITESIRTTSWPETKDKFMVNREVITYDDANKTAKLEFYKKFSSDNKEVLESVKVYELADDGTIASGVFNEYPVKQSSRAVLAENSFQENPNSIVTRIVKNDAEGNWTERYELVKTYKGTEVVGTSVYNYSARTITYY